MIVIPLEKEKTPVPQPLPGEPQRSPQVEISKNLFRTPEKRWNESLGFQGGSAPARNPLQIVLWSWLAAVIDGLILVSLSCLFLFSFILIMRLGFHLSTFKQLGVSGVVKAYLAVFIIASWLYLITTRTFLGCSLGEKACDLRLGSPLDRVADLYPLRVVYRNSMILITGVVLLPLISIVIKRDLPGQLSGLSLFSIQ